MELEGANGMVGLGVERCVVGRVGDGLAVSEEGVEEEAYTGEEEAFIPFPVKARVVGRRGGVEGSDGVFTPSELGEAASVFWVAGMWRGDGRERVRE